MLPSSPALLAGHLSLHHSRGVDHPLLRPLRQAESSATPQLAFSMALLNARSIANKTFLLNDFFTSRCLDFMFLTETWIRNGESSPFSELLPPDCSFFSSPRSTGNGGGLASVFRSDLQCRLTQPGTSYSSFELQLFVVNLSSPVLCAVVYRPPKWNKDFITEFSDFLSGVMVSYDHIIITGDFNIHVCCEAKPLVRDFLNMIDSFSLTQSVTGPTHEKGHTLDLVLSFGLSVSAVEICTTACLSDHLPVLFTVSVPCLGVTARAPARRVRLINPLTASHFSDVFNVSSIVTLDGQCNLSAEDLIAAFDSTCTEILDVVAPLRVKRSKVLSEPWLNDSTRALRRACRRAERRRKKDGLHVSLDILRGCLTDYQRAVKAAKTEYIRNLVSTNCHKPQTLFNVLNSVINPRTASPIVYSPALCEQFLNFFIDKISALRPANKCVTCTTPDSAPSLCHATFDCFEPTSLSALADVVKHLRPTNCPSDSIPSRLLKDVLDSVGSTVLLLINTCLISGCVPAAFKHAVVQPLIKKHNLDLSTLSNYRPISQLPFLSKVLEKVVYIQLQAFLSEHGIHEKFQSGFRPSHSTETALLRVLNDLLLTVDSGRSAVLVLLDLTAAFDTIDHAVLLSRLKNHVGITGTALTWFKSYLSDRSFSVHLGPFSSSVAPLTCGVPQGSILGPILFLLYILPLGSILSKHNISFHCFADDVQIYLPLQTSSKGSMQSLLDCLSDLKAWMEVNFLNLNEDKTEVITFGHVPPGSLTGILGPLSVNTRATVRNLGVLLDSELKFDKHISSVVKTSFFQLRLLAKTKAYLSRADLERVIHAFISSRIDYCNSLLVGLDQSSLRRLQLVQNAAARLLTGTKKREHISPVLASLHWLPVPFRIDFKILLLTFKALNGLAPPYLAELLHRHTPARALRSADQLLLVLPKTRLKTRGDRAFAAAAPRLWNSLPLSVRSAQSLGAFKSLLKTHFFSLAFNTN